MVCVGRGFSCENVMISSSLDKPGLEKRSNVLRVSLVSVIIFVTISVCALCRNRAGPGV